MSGIRVLERQHPDQLLSDFRDSVRAGLARSPRRLPSRYFYDAEGSRIFQEIMDMPEYYLPECESEILRSYAPEIVGHAGSAPLRIVELGAGDGRKTCILLDEFVNHKVDFEYAAIDISAGAVTGWMNSIGELYPDMKATGLVGEYEHGLHVLNESEGSNLVLFLGSTIGNFSLEQAGEFAARLNSALNPGDLVLIGFDLKKPVEIMQAAYDDAAKITARFNLNLLERINRELQADFETDRFSHYACYNAHIGSMESFLISETAQSVRVGALNASFHFERFEAIHTEFSWKYSESQIRDLANANHYENVAIFKDEREYFASALWRVR